MADRFLVTGALGCLGAWTCKLLVDEGVQVVAYDLGDDPHRLRLIMEPDRLAEVTVVPGDVTDLAQLERTLAEQAITHVVHLAALQVPFCKADPVRGARVNVVGTVNLFEAVKRIGLTTTIAYASSAAVYDADSNIAPATLYGVYKLANEGTARVYAQDAGVSSIGLRPFSVYGPGRDQGVTSTPTQAMLAAARGQAYTISFGGGTALQYAPDVARAFIQAARSELEAAAVYNIGGPATAIADLLDVIKAIAPGAQIDFDDVTLPFPASAPEPWFDVPLTPLEQGVRETIDLFRLRAA